MIKCFDFECTKCGHVYEKIFAEGEEVICPECKGGPSEIVWTKPTNKDWFPEGGMVMEHLDFEPIHVRSKKHLKELCLKYNVTSRALGDCRNITEI